MHNARLQFTNEAEALPAIPEDLSGWRVEKLWALVADMDGGSHISSSDAVVALFPTAELAQKATDTQERFRGGWGSRGRPHEVLALTKDGRSGFIVNAERFSIVKRLGKKRRKK